MSLRARVLAGMALIAVVVGVAALAVVRTTEGYLVRQVDEELDRIVGIRSAGTGRAFGRPDTATADGPDDVADPDVPEGHGGPDGEAWPGERLSRVYEAVVEEDDSVHTQVAPNFDDDARLPAVDAGEARAAAASGTAFTVGAAGFGPRYRARAWEEAGVVYVVALPIGDVDDTVERLVGVAGAATVAAVAVVGVVAWWVVHLGVRPLKRMTATASAIAAGDLSRRVPADRAGTEVNELGAALNRMLGHIEAAFGERARVEARLRQFIGDASHELRTPVTTIRGYAELYRAGGLDDAGELAEAMRRTGEESVRMGNLIDDMLLLARLDQGRPPAWERVDLALLAGDAARDARAVAPARSVSVAVAADGPLVVWGDPDRLRQVLANVVGNALVHTPPSAPIAVRAAAVPDAGRAVVEVADGGEGMAPEVAARAFERFYRADPSRSRHRGGSGLGLAIVAAAVAAHGGEVTIDSTPGRGTTVRLAFPLAGPA